MTSVAHIVETALLILAAYLAGCVLGYAARHILHAARGTRQVVRAIASVPIPVATVQPKRVRSPAARLAATSPEPAQSLPTQAVVSAATPPVTRRPAVEARPATLDAPRSGRADNLKQIKGIGPKIEALLNGMGIYHLDQIAGWTKANVDWVDSRLAFKGRIRREQWVEQATALAKAQAA